MMTGIKLIDAMVPISRGQHELIIGDHHLAPFSGCAMGEWFCDNSKAACSHDGKHSRVSVQGIDACLESRLSESVSESSRTTDDTEKS